MGNNKLIVGIAGGVGVGKSTVARELGKLGCAVISADAINHQVLQEPEVAERIDQWWGGQVTGSDGKIDRKALGNIVFNDAIAMKKLTDLVHPIIEKRQKALIQEYLADENITAIVLDVPLLFEVGQQGICDSVIFVRADEKVRIERLKAGRGWDVGRIKKIEKMQLELDIKAKMSDHMVENNSTISVLAAQVAEVFSFVLEARAARRGRLI